MKFEDVELGGVYILPVTGNKITINSIAKDIKGVITLTDNHYDIYCSTIPFDRGLVESMVICKPTFALTEEQIKEFAIFTLKNFSFDVNNPGHIIDPCKITQFIKDNLKEIK